MGITSSIPAHIQPDLIIHPFLYSLYTYVASDITGPVIRLSEKKILN